MFHFKKTFRKSIVVLHDICGNDQCLVISVGVIIVLTIDNWSLIINN